MVCPCTVSRISGTETSSSLIKRLRSRASYDPACLVGRGCEYLPTKRGILLGSACTRRHTTLLIFSQHAVSIWFAARKRKCTPEGVATLLSSSLVCNGFVSPMRAHPWTTVDRMESRKRGQRDPENRRSPWLSPARDTDSIKQVSRSEPSIEFESWRTLMSQSHREELRDLHRRFECKLELWPAQGYERQNWQVSWRLPSEDILDPW